jgi:hypothetical protein
MFLNFLDDDEKRAFAALAQKMIASDGIVVGREASTLAALVGEMGLDIDTVDTETSIADLAAAFTGRRSKIVALLELVGLGYSDTSFEGVERSLVAEVARSMNIDSGDLARIESWVRQHVDHLLQALTLMRE